MRRFHRRLELAGLDLVELLVQVSWAPHLRAGAAPGPILGTQALRGRGLRVAGGVNLWTSSGDRCAVGRHAGSLEELTPAHLDWLSALPKHGFGAHVLNAKSAREIERETAA